SLEHDALAIRDGVTGGYRVVPGSGIPLPGTRAVGSQLPEAGPAGAVPLSASEALARLSISEPSASLPGPASADACVASGESGTEVVVTSGARMCSSPIGRISRCTRRFIWRQTSLISMQSTPSFPRLTTLI